MLRFFAAWGEQMDHMMIGNIWNKLGQQLRDDRGREAWVAANGEVLARLRRRSVEVLPECGAREMPISCTAPRTSGWRRASSSRRWRRRRQAGCATSSRKRSPTRCGRSPRLGTRRQPSSTRWRRRRRGGCATSAQNLSNTVGVREVTRRRTLMRWQEAAGGNALHRAKHIANTCGRSRPRGTGALRCGGQRRRGGCATSRRKNSPTRRGRSR